MFARLITAAMLLALLSAAALAQNDPAARVNPCTGAAASATAPVYADIDLSKPWPACVSPSLPRVDANSAGIVGWRWCKGPTPGAYSLQWATIPWADFQAQPMLALRLNAAGLSMNENALKAVVAEYAALIKPLSDPANTAIWCPLWPKIAASRPAPVPDPPATAWVVAKNGTSSTRPTYQVLASGRRSLTSNGVARVGVACNVTGAVIEAPLTFGFPSGAPSNSVALCVRQ